MNAWIANRDFEFLCELFEKFFKGRHLRKTLTVLNDLSLTGWENWLQIELSRFLVQHQSIRAYGREIEYKLDKRMTSKTNMRADICIERKYTQEEKLILVELKRRVRVTNCITEMKKDVAKLAMMRRSDKDLRSAWVLGIHKSGDLSAAQINEKVLKALSKGVPHDPGQNLHSATIGSTGYAYTLFRA